MTWSVIATPDSNSTEELQGSFTPEQCCIECWNTPGCSYWFQLSGDEACFVSRQSGATEINECPVGVQTIEFGEGLPSWNTGPCGTFEP